MAFVYQHASGLARAARWALWADALVAAAAIVLSVTMGAEALIWGDLAQWFSILQLVTWLASLSLFLIWFYRANANARAMGADDLMGSPGLSVAWFFIPIAFLFMPYVVVRDTWKASEAPRDWQGRSASPLVGFWWAAMLLANLTATISIRIALAGRASRTPPLRPRTASIRCARASRLTILNTFCGVICKRSESSATLTRRASALAQSIRIRMAWLVDLVRRIATGASRERGSVQRIA